MEVSRSAGKSNEGLGTPLDPEAHSKTTRWYFSSGKRIFATLVSISPLDFCPISGLGQEFQATSRIPTKRFIKIQSGLPVIAGSTLDIISGNSHYLQHTAGSTLCRAEQKSNGGLGDASPAGSTLLYLGKLLCRSAGLELSRDFSIYLNNLVCATFGWPQTEPKSDRDLGVVRSESWL